MSDDRLEVMWHRKWTQAMSRVDQLTKQVRVLQDAVRVHQVSKGAAATAVDHELYRTAESNL
jgi:hypothetical protein